MASTGWSKVYWGDILNDPSLKMCSLAARGLWLGAILPLCGISDHRGYLEVAGCPVRTEDIPQLVGTSTPKLPEGRASGTRTVLQLVAELERNGVFSRDERGCIYNRRLVRDAAKSLKAQEDGAKGGNPALKPQDNLSLNLEDNPEDKPRAGKPKPKPKPIEPLEKESAARFPRMRARAFKNYLNGAQENEREPWAGAGELEGDLWMASHARKPDRDG